MTAIRMHAEEVDTDEGLVRRLLEAQFPEWAELPIERVSSAGTDNAIYRLGQNLAVRLPRIHWAVGQFDKDHHWLPRLAPHLPLAIPVPLARGEPAEGYPWHSLVDPALAPRHGRSHQYDHGSAPGSARPGPVHHLPAGDRLRRWTASRGR